MAICWRLPLRLSLSSPSKNWSDGPRQIRSRSRTQRNPDLFDNLNAEALESRHMCGRIGQQPDAMDTQIGKDLTA